MLAPRFFYIHDAIQSRTQQIGIHHNSPHVQEDCVSLVTVFRSREMHHSDGPQTVSTAISVRESITSP
jgi:hypothetical protein